MNLIDGIFLIYYHLKKMLKIILSSFKSSRIKTMKDSKNQTRQSQSAKLEKTLRSLVPAFQLLMKNFPL